MNKRYLIVPLLLAAALMVALPAHADDKDKGRDSRNDDREHSDRGQMKFRGMDRNNDGQISRAEWRGDDRSFANQDWNGDGVLSGNEVREDGRRDGRDGKSDRHGKNERQGDDNWRERFAVLDRNNNGSIARSEWDADRASFDRMDTDRNGNLSRDEFARWDEHYGNNERDGNRWRYGNDDLNTRFAALDRNNNGVIGSAEWQGDRATFNRLDTSRNGNLSREEFARWDQHYGSNYSNERFTALDRNNNGVIGSAEWDGDRATFDRLDTNRNGNLSRDEFFQGTGLTWVP